jgi:hypothetical protein
VVKFKFSLLPHQKWSRIFFRAFEKLENVVLCACVSWGWRRRFACLSVEFHELLPFRWWSSSNHRLFLLKDPADVVAASKKE